MIALEPDLTAAKRLALAGSSVGVLVALVLSLPRLAAAVVNNDPESGSILGNLAFLVSISAPFVLSLLVVQSRHAEQHAGVWFGAGLLALLAPFTTFSGIGLVFVPPGVLLLVAAGLASKRVEPSMTAVTALTVISVVVTSATALALLFLHQDPGCWELVRVHGQDIWEERSYGQAHGGGPGTRKIVCASDVITDREGGWSLLTWAFGGLLFFGMLRRWPSTRD